MATFLLAIIYIAFIGLGIPDSLFGTAWPAIYSDFCLPISYGSFVSAITSCGTIISSLFASSVIGRLGTSKTAAVSTLMTALGLIGFCIAPNLLTMCLLALPLGLGAGAIDIALNNYVALNYSASHMSFLHCFYGVGVTVSPYILSLVISGALGWRGGYKIAALIQLAIAALLFLTLPIWKKVSAKNASAAEENKKSLPASQAVKVPGVKLMCALFLSSCAIEWTCGGWGSTFLVEHKGVRPEYAASVMMMYYAGMTLGRFLSGIITARISCERVIKAGMLILGTAIVIMLFPCPAYLYAAAIFLIGLGNGPLFPNFTYLAPQNFGSELSQSVIGLQMASAYIGTLIAPVLCGILGQTIGMVIFPFYIFIFYMIMCAASVRFNTLFKSKEASAR